MTITRSFITRLLSHPTDMCYTSRLLINKFNARGSVYVLERRFTKFSEITQCYGGTAITPFKVIQGHQFWYQSKAHIRLPIDD